MFMRTPAELFATKEFLERARPFLPTIRALEFVPVISPEQNDTVDPSAEWSARSKVDARIARFKKPLFADGPNTHDQPGADPLAFLIVKSMLLTGFDAPVEQVLYLDRSIKEAELLQAIARVNRTDVQGGVAKSSGSLSTTTAWPTTSPQP
jgi:type I restriction enzyme R subunit